MTSKTYDITIIGGDEPGEFIQIKSIVAQGNQLHRQGQYLAFMIVLNRSWCALQNCGDLLSTFYFSREMLNLLF